MRTGLSIAVLCALVGAVYLPCSGDSVDVVDRSPVTQSTDRQAQKRASLAAHSPKTSAQGAAQEVGSTDRHLSTVATMELAQSAGPAQVDALLDQYWMVNDRSARLRLLYIFARTQGRFHHSGRDLLLQGEGFELLNEAVHGDLSADTGAALLALGALGNSQAVDVLASIGSDLEDPAAGDALFAMARFPSEAGVGALEGLALDGSNDAVSLRALEALVATVQLSSEADALTAEARNFLSTDGVNISQAIEEESEIAGVRHFARSLNQQLLSI
jgi:hypothetical protein